MKDQDLQKLFAEMKLQNPTPTQLNRWQRFMNSEIARSTKKSVRQMWWQWLVAGSIGFASATFYFKSPVNPNPREIYSETATSEYTFDK